MAGNSGPRSSTLRVTIDTTDPDAPVAPDLDVASDTGDRHDDDITAITLRQFPVFNLTGIEPTATVFLVRKPAASPSSSYAVVNSRVGPGR